MPFMAARVTPGSRRSASMKVTRPFLRCASMLLEPAAGQIVHDVHVRAALEQCIHQMRSDKRCAAGDENFLMIPDGALHSFRLPLLP